MADKLTKAELDDLKAAGYVPGNMRTFPENVSPVLRAKALRAWVEENGPQTATDLPPGVDVHNELERERAEGETLVPHEDAKPKRTTRKKPVDKGGDK